MVLTYGARGAVAFCHKHYIAHRDLKLDNVLLDAATPPRILLTDFGFAKRWGRGQHAKMSGYLGTLVYSAPELLHDGEYDATVGSEYTYLLTTPKFDIICLLMLPKIYTYLPINHAKDRHVSAYQLCPRETRICLLLAPKIGVM